MRAILTAGAGATVYWCIRYAGKVLLSGEAESRDSAIGFIQSTYGGIRIIDFSQKERGRHG